MELGGRTAHKLRGEATSLRCPPPRAPHCSPQAQRSGTWFRLGLEAEERRQGAGRHQEGQQKSGGQWGGHVVMLSENPSWSCRSGVHRERRSHALRWREDAWWGGEGTGPVGRVASAHSCRMHWCPNRHLQPAGSRRRPLPVTSMVATLPVPALVPWHFEQEGRWLRCSFLLAGVAHRGAASSTFLMSPP